MFKLHPQLEKDTVLIGDSKLSRLLLVNDKNYPWVIMVPKKEDVREVFQLCSEDQFLLSTQSSLLAELMNDHFVADKMNVAALGNMVEQLHIHHVVRFKNDSAWPAPIWGVTAAIPYSEEELIENVGVYRDFLKPLELSF